MAIIKVLIQELLAKELEMRRSRFLLGVHNVHSKVSAVRYSLGVSAE